MVENEKTSSKRVWHYCYKLGVGPEEVLLTQEEIESLHQNSEDIRSYTLNEIKKNSRGNSVAQKINRDYLANRT